MTRRGVAAAVVLLLSCGVLTAVSVGRAGADASTTDVVLGDHRFGQLDTAAAVVASAPATGVGWVAPAEGPGFGPWSFDIAPDGSTWLLDEVNNRLLVWPRGEPSARPRVVALPFRGALDMTIGPNGTVYVASCPAGQTCDVYALDPSGGVRWRVPQPEDRSIGALVDVDGVLYFQFTKWWPITDRAGRPLTVAEQRTGASADEPLPGGHRLVEEATGNPVHEIRFRLVDDTGTVVRTWRVSARQEIGTTRAPDATLVAGDLVLTISIDEQSPAGYQYEYLLFRLPRSGGPPLAQLTLEPPARAVWGESLSALRVEPDGLVYQLRSNRTTGVQIVRSVMRATSTPPTTATSAPSTVSPATTSAPSTTGRRTTTVPSTAVARSTSAATSPTGQRGEKGPSALVWLVVALVAGGAAAAIVQLARRRRRPSRPEAPPDDGDDAPTDGPDGPAG